MSQYLLSQLLRKITEMISNELLLDTHSFPILDSPRKYCALVVLMTAFVICEHTYLYLQEFHHCQHISSLPILINLHLFHCREITLFWNRGRFHPSSNYLQYRPHVHLRLYLKRQNTPQSRCTKSALLLPSSFRHGTLSRHVAQ